MVDGTRLNEARLRDNVDNSVMVVTALTPAIGYDRASHIARYAVEHGITVREAAIAHDMTGEQFDALVDPAAVAGRRIPR